MIGCNSNEYMCVVGVVFFFQAEDGIRDLVRSRGLGDVYKRQGKVGCVAQAGQHRTGTCSDANDRICSKGYGKTTERDPAKFSSRVADSFDEYHDPVGVGGQ